MTCGRTYSRQAFSVGYFLKRPELLCPVAAGLQAGSAHRQLARTLGCAPSTVTRLSARLGRHSMLLMSLARQALQARLDEPVVLDHFETFELSQDLPFGVATPVGSRSWFVYGVDPAPHARTGRRTAPQDTRRRQRMRRPTRGGYAGSTRRTLDVLLSLAGQQPLHLVGDGHPAYTQATAKHDEAGRIQLQKFPNPKRGPKGSPRSDEAKARDRAMFPVDLLHGLLRHSLAAHRRETIAFGRRLNALCERLYLAAVWRNFVKGVSERKADRTTPAMKLALTGKPWKWKEVLSRRLFVTRQKLTDLEMLLYRRDWTTPDLPANTRHHLIYAD